MTSSLVHKAVVATIGFGLLCGVCFAQETTPKQEKVFHGIELLSGYGVADTSYAGHYDSVPVFVDLDFSLKRVPWIKRIFPGICDFVLEPFSAYVVQPRRNAEVGTSFFLKIGFLPETSKFQPYFKGGTGVMFMTQHLREQSTQFNFSDSAALGAHFFVKKNLALTMEYRFRHISNAGIKSPNHGVNTNFGLCGLTYLF